MAKGKRKSGAVSKSTLEDLKLTALMTRIWVINMTHKAGSGHPGGSLSATDVITALYFNVMNHDPKSPRWEDRDRFVLSKGHAAPALYASLAQAGYFDLKELMTLRKLGSNLQGHPDMKRAPGIESSTGSEGQGLSNGIGMALAGRLDNKNYHVYVMLGDGEMDCGQIWEAAMSAAHFKVDNLTAIIDRNDYQLDGATKDIMEIEPLKSKWLKFGWNVIDINGHSFRKILYALNHAKKTKNKPTVIIAKTVKGKGVSFMENTAAYHGRATHNLEYLDSIEKFLNRFKNRNFKVINKKYLELMKKLLIMTEQHLKSIPDEAIMTDARKYQKNIEEYLNRKKTVLRKISNMRNKP